METIAGRNTTAAKLPMTSPKRVVVERRPEAIADIVVTDVMLGMDVTESEGGAVALVT